MDPNKIQAVVIYQIAPISVTYTKEDQELLGGVPWDDFVKKISTSPQEAFCNLESSLDEDTSDMLDYDGDTKVALLEEVPSNITEKLMEGMVTMHITKRQHNLLRLMCNSSMIEELVSEYVEDESLDAGYEDELRQLQDILLDWDLKEG